MGYDANGVYHDDHRGIFYILMRWFGRLVSFAFWHSPALFMAYALFAGVRQMWGGLKGLPGLGQVAAVLLVARGISWLMAKVSCRARAMRARANAVWMILWAIAFLYGFFLPVLIWRALFVVGMGWRRDAGTDAWISWLVAGAVGMLIFWRNQVAVRR
jgi:hypothetical protein